MMEKEKTEQRLEKLLALLRSGIEKTKTELSQELGVSIPSVSRDIKKLRDRNMDIHCIEGKYSIENAACKEYQDGHYAYDQKRDFNILGYIYKHNICSYNMIKSVFQLSESKKYEPIYKCSGITLNTILEQFVAEGLITKTIKPDDIYFQIARQQFKTRGLPIDLCVNIIKFIRANIAPLPLNHTLAAIVHKLENAIVKSVAGNYLYSDQEMRTIYEEMGGSFKFFSNGHNNDVDKKQEQILQQLTDLCECYALAEIRMKGKTQPIRRHCLFTLCHISLDRWYLVIKTHKKNRGYGLIRIDRIEEVKRIEGESANQELKICLEEAKMDAYFEIIESFGMGLGGKIEIKLKIFPDVQALQTIMLRLEKYLFPEKTVFYEDGSCDIEIEIDGVSDFLYWFSGFGDKAIIMEPEYLAAMHNQELRSMLEVYEEGYDGQSLS